MSLDVVPLNQVLPAEEGILLAGRLRLEGSEGAVVFFRKRLRVKEVRIERMVSVRCLEERGKKGHGLYDYLVFWFSFL